MKSKALVKKEKNKKPRLLYFIGIISLFAGISSVTEAQTGEELFKKNCGICHTVGAGKLIGPDLIGVNTRRKEEWIIKFVKGSQAFIKSGDADAKAIFDQFNVVMPDQNVTDAEIKTILSFIAEKGPAPVATADTAKTPAAPEVVKTDKATPEEIELGKQLFEGSTRFVNGGASCVSCHNVNYAGLVKGGVLAKDLSNSFSRLGGEAGIMGILGAPPFPAMTSAFKDNPLTEKEIFALTAFLNKADKDAAKQPVDESNPLFFGGGIGFLIILGLIVVIWMSRKTSSVKESIYKRQIKSH